MHVTDFASLRDRRAKQFRGDCSSEASSDRAIASWAGNEFREFFV